MSVPFTRQWRAPRWMPLFVRRRWLGVWTQAEGDAIRACAKVEFRKAAGL